MKMLIDSKLQKRDAQKRLNILYPKIKDNKLEERERLIDHYLYIYPNIYYKLSSHEKDIYDLDTFTKARVYLDGEPNKRGYYILITLRIQKNNISGDIHTITEDIVNTVHEMHNLVLYYKMLGVGNTSELSLENKENGRKILYWNNPIKIEYEIDPFQEPEKERLYNG